MYPHDAPLPPIESRTPELQRFLRLERATTPQARRPVLWKRVLAHLRAPAPPPAVAPSRGYLRRD